MEKARKLLKDSKEISQKFKKLRIASSESQSIGMKAVSTTLCKGKPAKFVKNVIDLNSKYKSYSSRFANPALYEEFLLPEEYLTKGKTYSNTITALFEKPSNNKTPARTDETFNPLVLDMFGTGRLKTTPIKKEFKLSKDEKVLTSWVNKGLGMLAFMPDNNTLPGDHAGTILSNYSQIGTKRYHNGFSALQALAKKNLTNFYSLTLRKEDILELEKKAGLCIFLHNKTYSPVHDFNITEICLEFKKENRQKDMYGNDWQKTGWFIKDGKKHLIFEPALQFATRDGLLSNEKAYESVKFVNCMLPVAEALGHLTPPEYSEFTETTSSNTLWSPFFKLLGGYLIHMCISELIF